MTELKRAKPVRVPEDWRAISLRAEMRLKQDVIESSQKLGDEKAEQELRSKPIQYIRSDFFVFFETALATPEVANAIKNQIPYFYREPGEEIPDHSWGVTRVLFEQWWITERYDVNVWGLSQMVTKYISVAFRGFVEFFTSGDVEKAYEIMTNELDELGIE